MFFSHHHPRAFHTLIQLSFPTSTTCQALFCVSIWQVELNQTPALDKPYSLRRETVRKMSRKKHVVFEKCYGEEENRVRTIGSMSWGPLLKREIG